MNLVSENEVHKMLDSLIDQELDPECSVIWNRAIGEAISRLKNVPVEAELYEPEYDRSWKRRIVNVALMTVFVAVAISMLILGLFEGSLFMILLAAGGLTWAIYEVINGGLE